MPCSANRVKLAVGQAAPQEVRQPRGQLIVVDLLDACANARAGVELDAKQEVRRYKGRLDGQLDPFGEVAALAARQANKLDQPVHFLGSRRPTIGAAGKVRQDLSRAAVFIAVGGLAKDNSPVRLRAIIRVDKRPFDSERLDDQITIALTRVRVLWIFEVVQIGDRHVPLSRRRGSAKFERLWLILYGRHVGAAELLLVERESDLHRIRPGLLAIGRASE